MLLNSKKSLKCKMLTFKCFWKMTKRDLLVASTRHHLARLLKYYPRRPCAPSLIKSRFFPYTTNLLTVLTFLLLKFLTCIHAGNPRMPPRVLASGPKPAGAIILCFFLIVKSLLSPLHEVGLSLPCF